MSESYFGLGTGAIKSARRIGGIDKHPLIEVTFNDPTSIPEENPS